jgi:multiple sugar transport system permease protein
MVAIRAADCPKKRKGPMRNTNKLYPYLLVAPALLLMFFVSLYPTLYSFYLSLTRVRRGELQFVGLENFQLIFTSSDFWESLQLTLIFGVFYIGLTVLFAFLLALLFNRGLRFGGFYMTLIFIPWVLSEIVSGVVWRWMFYRDYGILQNLLGPLFGDVTLMADKVGAMGIVTASSIWRSIAFAMLLILAGLQTIPKTVYEAASIDGANRWESFWKITWPLVKPTTLVTTVYLSIQAINAIGMFLAITDGGPGRATEVLSLHMYREALQYFHFGYGAALSVIMFLINAVLAAVYIRSLQTDSPLASGG